MQGLSRRGRVAGALVAAIVLSVGVVAVPVVAADDDPFDRARIRTDDDGAARAVLGEPYLTAPSDEPAAQIALAFASDNRELFGLTETQVGQLVVARDYVTAKIGASHVTLGQEVDGHRVANRGLTFAIDRDGRIVSVGGPLARGAPQGRLALDARGAIDAAIKEADDDPELDLEVVVDTLRRVPAPVTRSTTGREHRIERFDNTFARVQNPNPVTAEPVWYETADGSLRLAYEVDFEVDGDHWFVTYVDASTGATLEQFNRYAHAAPQGTVFTGQHPDDSPARSIEPFSGSNGSWVDGEVTSGPNVNAYRDLDNSNTVGHQPDPQADGLTSQHFEYAWTDTWRTNAQDTMANLDADIDAAITQLFYYTNVMHEWSLAYGFDDAAGNFQDDDPVLAEAQDGWNANPRRRNNANFATPPDGTSPRMQMYLWDGQWRNQPGDPWGDGSMDGDVIAHEYGHGITHRLVGGSDALFGYNAHRVHSSLSEGWADIISFLKWGDSVIGEYVTGDAATGIRRVAYDDSDHTYNTYNPLAGSGHPNGEVWASMIHDVRDALGPETTTWLVFTGMKNTPGLPDFLDARDGIFTADTFHNGGENHCTLWRIFADRGLGVDAEFDFTSTTRPADDHTVPDGCLPVADAGGPYTTPEGTDVTVTAAASTPGSDPTGGAIVSYEWDLDGDGEFDDATGVTATFDEVGDGNPAAVVTVSVRVTNAAGISSEASTTVSVTNVTPTVTLDPVTPTTEGTSTTLSGVISDPGWLDTLTATVDWDDGEGVQPLTGTTENVRPDATLTFSVDFTYGDAGTFTIEVCGEDKDGAEACATVDAVISNEDPTTAIDQDLYIGQEGVPLDVGGGSTDPGSDDLTATWDWGDGTSDSETDLVNPPNPDPPKSPSIQPRDVTWSATHTYTDACLYTLGLTVVDDDSGTSDDEAVVVIVGTGTQLRATGWWMNQYRPQPPNDFTTGRLECYLEITSHLSDVFDEVRGPLGSRSDAVDVLFVRRNRGTDQELFDSQLLAAWLNFADGVLAFDTLVDTTGDGVEDTNFEDAIRHAESVRLDPSATRAELLAQKDVLERIVSG